MLKLLRHCYHMRVISGRNIAKIACKLRDVGGAIWYDAPDWRSIDPGTKWNFDPNCMYQIFFGSEEEAEEHEDPEILEMFAIEEVTA